MNTPPINSTPPPIPQAGQAPVVINNSGAEDLNNTNFLAIFVTVGFSLFILGNMIFTLSNYAQIRNLKKQLEQAKTSKI